MLYLVNIYFEITNNIKEEDERSGSLKKYLVSTYYVPSSECPIVETTRFKAF